MPFSELALVPSRSTIRWCDAAALVAIAVFAALGTAAGLHLTALADLHRTLGQAAETLDVTAATVAGMADVPFVGDDAGRLAGSIGAAATELRAGAAALDDRLQALGLIAGAAVTAVPVVPLVVLVYAPLRLARSRELRALRRMLAGPPDPALVEHLARSAVHRLPIRLLHRTSRCAWVDLARGHHAPLATAELRRLGVRTPARLAPPPGR
ncbi:hypothetical protein BJF90_00990 [Pseudonocardia sp. CNS-004]|nr:hypothetical protein BJF90_00990 [Pseudonocardia sp. CNS-004]